MRLNLRFSYRYAAKAELGGKSSNLLYFFYFYLFSAPLGSPSCSFPFEKL